MQGTVRSFSPSDHTGTVLLDDGTEIPYGAAAFAAGGLRLLRSGQRVRLRLNEAGDEAVFVTILTLAEPGGRAPG